jgi:hypothetical protein
MAVCRAQAAVQTAPDKRRQVKLVPAQVVP